MWRKHYILQVENSTFWAKGTDKSTTPNASKTPFQPQKFISVSGRMHSRLPDQDSMWKSRPTHSAHATSRRPPSQAHECDHVSTNAFIGKWLHRIQM